jgi:hypothetical protein
MPVYLVIIGALYRERNTPGGTTKKIQKQEGTNENIDDRFFVLAQKSQTSSSPLLCE